MCAFCAQPLPESGKVCCAEYAESLDDPTFYGPSGAEPIEPVFAAARETARRARFVFGSQFLVGLLASGVGALALMLVHQGRIADERARELEATRRLSEEMIALMKETRVAAAKPVIEPQGVPADPGATAAVPAPETATESAPVPPATSEPASEPGVHADAGDVDAARPAPAVVPPVAASEPSSSTPDAVAAAAPAVAAAPRAEAPRETRRDAERAASPAPSVAKPESAATHEQAAEPKPAVKPKPAPARVASARPVSPAKAEAVAEAAPAPRASSSAGERVAAVDASEPVASARGASPKPSDPEVEERIRELASRAFPPQQAAVARPAAVSIPWQKLERGMSPAEVESLLGKPRWVENLMTGEFWLYGDRSILGRGWVAFSDQGVVRSWSTP